jgi:hypothetical protein
VTIHLANARFLMWIDAVGGYLVCLGDRIVLGQAAEASRDVDVPILADLSRRHAILRRDAEGYLVQPIHTLRVNGRTVDGMMILKDGDLVQLGSSVAIRFRKPHALSATACLELVSHHKTQPSVNSVLLMAETCILGPGTQNHVRCRGWGHDLILFRQIDELYCRSAGSFQIDGRLCQSRGRLTTKSRIEGDDFSLSLEPV